MVRRRESEPQPPPTRRRPATTPEARENQMIALAVELAEKQLSAGTASAQVISHYLKLGSSREQLEQDRMAKEIQLMEAKAEILASQNEVKALYEEALKAMRKYSGQDPTDRDDRYDD